MTRCYILTAYPFLLQSHISRRIRGPWLDHSATMEICHNRSDWTSSLFFQMFYMDIQKSKVPETWGMSGLQWKQNTFLLWILIYFVCYMNSNGLQKVPIQWLIKVNLPSNGFGLVSVIIGVVQGSCSWMVWEAVPLVEGLLSSPSQAISICRTSWFWLK